MKGPLRSPSRAENSPAADRRARPQLEGLEDRLLLYATLGANWTYGIRITYSFVPDGTSIGGVPSVLFQSLNAKFATADWQREFQDAAAVWQSVANVNLVQVPDNGSPLGATGNQQGDSRFGDIRISAIPLSYGTMGAAFSPPPINGGSAAGDVVLNSTMSWQINAHYDLKTVAIHEIGHALGMDHSQINTAAMFSYYTTMKQNVTNDDIAGVRSIYQDRQPDGWNSGGQSNGYWLWAKSLDTWRTSSNQISVPFLNLTWAGQTEWFWVTIPASNSGSLVVKMQSSALSSLSPYLAVFDSSMNYLSEAVSRNYGDTVTVTIPGVTQGKGFFIRAGGSDLGAMTGMFGLQFNFGSVPLTPFPPVAVAVPSQPDHGGGISSMTTSALDHEGEPALLKLGGLTAWGDALMIPGKGHAPGYLEAVARSARAVDPQLTVTLLARSAVDPTLPYSLGTLALTISPKLAAPVSSPVRLTELDTVLREWALDETDSRPAIARPRLVGAIDGR